MKKMKKWTCFVVGLLVLGSFAAISIGEAGVSEKNIENLQFAEPQIEEKIIEGETYVQINIEGAPGHLTHEGAHGISPRGQTTRSAGPAAGPAAGTAEGRAPLALAHELRQGDGPGQAPGQNDADRLLLQRRCPALRLSSGRRAHQRQGPHQAAINTRRQLPLFWVMI